jgi:TRAP-type C4-dicarboxylate transport system, small permease component
MKFIKFFAIASVVIIFAEVIYEVLSRYILLRAVPWGAEVSQTLMIWMTFLGAGCAFHKGQHMAIDYLVRSIPSTQLRNAVIHLANVSIAALLILGFFSGVEVVSMTWDDRTTALQIPGGIVYLAFPVSMALMLILLGAKYVSGTATQAAPEEGESPL